MADIFTMKKRSEIMSRIRSSGTRPEERLFQSLSAILGKRLRIKRNVRTLPGQPDFVIPSLRLALFVDGCFYHGCPKHGHNPKSNKRYWIPKLARNLARDRVNRRALRKLHFAVWRIWEHSLTGQNARALHQRIALRVEKRRLEIAGRRSIRLLDPISGHFGGALPTARAASRRRKRGNNFGNKPAKQPNLSETENCRIERSNTGQPLSIFQGPSERGELS